MTLERLLGYVVCPKCHGRLERDPGGEWLVCNADRLAYPFRDGIACLTADAAVARDSIEPG